MIKSLIKQFSRFCAGIQLETFWNEPFKFRVSLYTIWIKNALGQFVQLTNNHARACLGFWADNITKWVYKENVFT